MSENSALSDLTKKLEAKKSRELELVKEIEAKSINELAQSLKASLQTELSSIKESIYEVQKFVNAKNKIIVKNSEVYSSQIEKNFTDLNDQLVKIRAKQWIIPAVMGISIVLALALGTWGVTKYLENQLKVVAKLNEVREEVKEYKPVLKVWNNGIEIKKGYQAKLVKTENGTYFLEIKE